MAATRDVYVVAAARTPQGRFLGALRGLTAPKLGALAIRGAVDRCGLDPALIEATFMGNVVSAGLGQAPARQASLAAGLPASSTATTVNRVCASGMDAVNQARLSIMAGDISVGVAGGMESMSGAPHMLRGSRDGIRLGEGRLDDAVIVDGLWCSFSGSHMGVLAEVTAERHGIGRDEMDGFAYSSHQRALAARRAGAFRDEIVPTRADDTRHAVAVMTDEGPRADTSPERLALLTPAFRDHGRITAGNAPGLADGAAALVLASDSAVGRHDLKPLARLIDCVAVGSEPDRLFEAPADAIRKLSDKTGIRLNHHDLLEVNEAFAAQILANGRALDWDWARVNINGGAIALGHPIGATGARIVVSLTHALRARGLKRGLAALCHGGGGAMALAVEAV
ncbi:MAG: thiolase family protein [Chloroflexota bacterium]